MKAYSAVATTALAALLCTSTIAPAHADTLQGGVSKTKTSGGTFLQRHPKVKGAAVGGLVGAGTGAVAGLLTGKGIMRGAAIGTGTGAGIGLIQTSKTMKRHPYVKNTAIGTVAGAGLGMAVTKGHGTGKNMLKAGAVGAGLGLGATFLTKQLSK